MAAKTWKPFPLHTFIVESLQRKGPLTDVELYEMVKGTYGDLGFNALNRELMQLEIEGIIHVSALTRGKRRVEVLNRVRKERGRAKS